ncbi:MAG: hypothetical protein HOP29_19440 [Phycisphaerales bacterium]|nr:hypothetical protein [Phycisphaerales bacterium]
MRRYSIPNILVGAWLLAGALLLLSWEPAATHRPVVEIPSLTAWGKIFSMLLLAALGVSYIVWRRPVVRAQAILETSPLGTGSIAPPLVDWLLYAKLFLVVNGLAMLGVMGIRLSGRVLSALDTLGVLASGAIVAFVVHLLLLSRRDLDGDRPGR